MRPRWLLLGLLPCACDPPSAPSRPTPSAPRVVASTPVPHIEPRVLGRIERAELLLLDASTVYALSNGDQAHVASLPRAGGALRALTPPASAAEYGPHETLTQTRDFLLFSRTVVVEVPSLKWGFLPHLAALPKAGGPPTTYAPLLPGKADVAAIGLVSDGSRVFWLEGRHQGAANVLTAKRLVTTPLAGGKATLVTSGLRDATELAVDGDDAFVTSVGGQGAIVRVAVNDGALSVLASNCVDPEALAVDAEHVYWVEDDRLQRVARKGGAVETVVASFDAVRTFYRRAWAMDERWIYWTTPHGRVERIAKTGGAITDLANGAELGPIAVDAAEVVYVSGDRIVAGPK